MDFYTIVLIIAIVLLIAVLTGLGLMLTKVGTTADFPPTVSDCPDGWTNNNGICTPNGSNNIPTKIYSSFGSGTSTYPIGTSTSSPNSVAYINWFYSQNRGVNGSASTDLMIDTNKLKNVCDRKIWANANGIIWNGVTNSNAKC